jgi:rubrerythrin
MAKRRRRAASVPAQPTPLAVLPRRETEAPPPEDAIWVCPNCGQKVFGALPPDLCATCADFTTWRRVLPD